MACYKIHRYQASDDGDLRGVKTKLFIRIALLLPAIFSC